jgi:hypothetical protein
MTAHRNWFWIGIFVYITGVAAAEHSEAAVSLVLVSAVALSLCFEECANLIPLPDLYTNSYAANALYHLENN